MICSILVSGKDRNSGRLGFPMVKVSTGLETGKRRKKLFCLYNNNYSCLYNNNFYEFIIIIIIIIFIPLASCRVVMKSTFIDGIPHGNSQMNLENGVEISG